MANNTVLNPGAAGDTIATEDIAGTKYELIKLIDSTAGAVTPIGVAANPLKVSLPAGFATSANQATEVASLASIDAKLTAPLVVSGTVSVTGSTVGIVGNVEVVNDIGNPLPVSGTVALSTAVNLEATQLLIKAKTDNLDVALSTRLKPADTLAAVTSITNVVHVDDNAGSLTVDGPVTDVQLRATPVPISGTVALSTAVNLEATQLLVKAKTDNLDVALSTRNLEATQLLVKAKTDNLDVLLSTRLKPADTLAAVTTVTAVTAITNALPAGANVIGGITGDVDDDAVNTLKTVQVGGHASPVDVPPAAVSANGDRRRIWVDRFGAQIVRRRKIRESYTAVFRLAEAAVRLDGAGFLQVANTNKQWATLHHLVGATKEVRLQYVTVWITSWAVASQAVLELREINTAPATGNPAITPKMRRFGGAAAEAVCLYLPTTAGTEVSVNSPVKSWFVDEGVMGVVGTANPLPPQGFTLYNSALEDDEMLAPTLPVATLSGWALMLRTVIGSTVRLVCEMGFTEEIP